MIYETSQSFRGDSSKAMEAVAAALGAAGLEIIERGEGVLRADGRRAISGEHVSLDPMRKIAVIEVRAGSGSLSARVDIRRTPWPKQFFVNIVFFVVVPALLCRYIAQPGNVFRLVAPICGAGLVLVTLISSINPRDLSVEVEINRLLQNAAAMAGNKESK